MPTKAAQAFICLYTDFSLKDLKFTINRSREPVINKISVAPAVDLQGAPWQRAVPSGSVQISVSALEKHCYTSMAGTGAGQNAASTARENSRRVSARKARLRRRGLGGMRIPKDVNPIQEDLVAILHGLGAGLTVVGDDDQTLYRWRGSDVASIPAFADHYPACGPPASKTTSAPAGASPTSRGS